MIFNQHSAVLHYLVCFCFGLAHSQSSVAFVQTHASCSGAIRVQSQLFAAHFGSCRSMVHSRLAPITVLCTAEGHAHYPHTLDLITTYIALLSNGLLLFQY